MQVTETSSEGLKRKLKVVVGADELGERFTAHLDKIKDQVQLKGFRKGKVPLAHIKKVFGRSVMNDVLQETIRETSNKAIVDRKERPAMMPDIALAEGASGIDSVVDGKADLAYEMSFEVLPEVELADFKSLKLERLVVDVDDEQLDKALSELADRNQAFEAEEGRAAGDGDRVTIDFTGTVDGVAFDRGSGENLQLVIGNAGFIPGFEEGIKGAKKDESRDVKATFPAEYPVADLAGKDAVFAITVKEVEKPVKAEINDEFAKSLGTEGLDNLKSLVSAQIKRELDQASRQKIKRELLDALETAHSFELPPTLVEREFEAIWKQVTDGLQREQKSFADEGKTEEEARAEYRKIAERRVRLGLVVGEIGDKNKIEVTQDEMRRALMEHARRFPGQEKNVYEYFEKTPGALQELRAPIFEDKVIDFVLELAKPAEKKVSRQELLDSLEKVAEA
ncbi:trigger factor [Hyphomicrobium sp. LHD-15]|uniref:trigger factor n=1 Tax=Hyphomicrobium sp. LHD-15 TaxID=3072142 RepID=UPI00280D42A9|nr:trigger factor [Hyphomicrobium sp. LHD-15]MDQ8699730.1 trigger factor [Hyphomicrobium sp. LHD-15]